MKNGINNLKVERNDRSGEVSEESPAGEKTSISELLSSQSNDK